jgi:SAM-dependent methyltransferase
MTPELTSRWPAAAAEAYDALADAYDVFTGGYCYDEWLERIEEQALGAGCSGRRLLDVACGTGKSFLPLLARGYDVMACDISPRMVQVARAKAPEVDISVWDMRSLPRLGEFDLITCLDDAVNYLLDVDELDAFFAGVARNLARNGVLAFDVNSLAMYRDGFGNDWLVDAPSAFVAWTARDAAQMRSGGQMAATIHVFTRDGARWLRTASRHRQRHWPQAALAAAAARASLRVVTVLGQHRGAILERRFVELEHTKALCLAIRDEEVSA